MQMLDPDIPLGQLAASIQGPQGPPTLAVLAAAVLRSMLTEQLSELREAGANPVLLSLRPPGPSADSPPSSTPPNGLQPTNIFSTARTSPRSAHRSGGSFSMQGVGSPRQQAGPSTPPQAASPQVANPSQSEGMSHGDEGRPPAGAQAGPSSTQQGEIHRHAGLSDDGQGAGSAPRIGPQAAAWPSVDQPDASAQRFSTSPPVTSPFAEAAGVTQKEREEAVFDVGSAPTHPAVVGQRPPHASPQAWAEQSGEVSMQIPAGRSPRVQVPNSAESPFGSSSNADHADASQVMIDQLPTGSLPATLNWQPASSPAQPAQASQPASQHASRSGLLTPPAQDASGTASSGGGQRRNSQSGPSSPLKSPKPWLKKQIARLARSPSQGPGLFRGQERPQPSSSLPQSMSSPSLAPPLQRLPELATSLPEAPNGAARGEQAPMGHAQSHGAGGNPLEPHSRVGDHPHEQSSQSGEADASSVATDTESSSQSGRTSVRHLFQGGHKWEWESYRGPLRRSVRSDPGDRPGPNAHSAPVSAPASPRFETIQHFLDTREQLSDDTPEVMLVGQSSPVRLISPTPHLRALMSGPTHSVPRSGQVYQSCSQ